MAERRMFAKTIIDSDAFLDLPTSARLLYFDLAIRADDDGFVNSTKKIIRMTGASMQDLQALIENGYVILFEESGVAVIRHWLIHNYIRKDMYKPTPYKKELKLLAKDENNAYVLRSEADAAGLEDARDESVTDPAQVRDESVTDPAQVRDEFVTCSSTQDRSGKDNTGKERADQENEEKVNSEKGRADEIPADAAPSHFEKPTIEDIRAYEREMCLTNKAEKFYYYYESRGWTIGGNHPIADWKAARMRWEHNGIDKLEPEHIEYQIGVDHSWRGFDDGPCEPLSEEKQQAIQDCREGKITAGKLFEVLREFKETDQTA